MTELRMRGLPPALIVSSLVAAAPLGYVLVEKYRFAAPVPLQLLALSVALAALPWLSRLVGRIAYRADVDEIALHVGPEALIWTKITRAFEQRTWRRQSLVLERGRTARVELVVRDVFAGRLEPIAVLEQRLADHGVTIERSAATAE